MQTAKTILTTLICIALLSACGLKGPLYLSDEIPSPESATQQGSSVETDAEENKKDAEDTEDTENNTA